MASVIDITTRPGEGTDDERLAARVGAGDHAAFSAIHDRYSAALYRYCWSILRDESDAQDTLQSAWIKALVALGQGQRDAPLRPWLYRICHNEAISLLRRRRPVRELDMEIPGAASAEHIAVERERFARLIADLQTLPERSRGALE